MRVKFDKKMQRKFLQKVLIELNCVSLRSLLQYGFDIPYSTLKNYYTEERCMPYEFFKDLCYLAKINQSSLKVQLKQENWGQIKGGEKFKRK